MNGARVFLTAVTAFACFAAGQRITTIQLDGTQYYISRMNPYSAELNYFLAYEYCRSIGLQLASFETLEKTNSISDFLRNAGYNKFDYWTSGNRLGTDMLIWMSTGLPFNTTFNQMKRPSSPDNNGLDEDLKLNARPELPIARKKRGESGSRDGCVAIKAPNMDWVTTDCTDLKDFICEQTRCYYYNYGSIPVSSSQGFGHKQKPASFHPTTAVSSDGNATGPVATTISASTHSPPGHIATADFTATPDTASIATAAAATTTSTATTTTSTSTDAAVTTPAAIITATADGHAEPETTFATTPAVAEDESAAYAATTEPPPSVPPQQQQTDGEFQESRTDEQPPQPSTVGRLLSRVTELPTLIQMHNQQQLHEQLRRDGDGDGDDDDRSDRDTAYAFESLEKAFATAVPLKVRSTKDLERPKDAATAAGVDQLPWSWAKDIMLQKPVLRKSSREVV